MEQLGCKLHPMFLTMTIINPHRLASNRSQALAMTGRWLPDPWSGRPV